MSESYTITPGLIQIIDAELAYKYRVIPLEEKGGTVVFRTDADNFNALQNELQIILGHTVELVPDTEECISRMLSTNYRKIQSGKTSNIHYSTDFLEKILVSAKESGSSDIHFEPFENRSRVRFRLDGKLKEQYTISKDEYPLIVNKIKIKAQLDISEKRLPQDGRITIFTDYFDFDIRVSVMPTLHGEKIVLRILSKDSDHINLNSLGFTEQEMKIYLENIKKPYGIVLISGPTGSGKTTTLYATLKLLNKADNNILTVEDPIEYTIEGINQVQLKESIGLDFASTMRTFLRQDPDIIMVGEIRDLETAAMAIKAALTGHLVLSTIHTNSAWATISRLIDMGIPSFLIANTLNISIAQRLVRKLCNDCKTLEDVSQDIFPTGFTIPEHLRTHYKPTGCLNCYYTGYSGRKALYEILPIDKELMSHIKNNELNIDGYLSTKQTQTLKTNAIALVKDGTTSVDEVFPLLMD